MVIRWDFKYWSSVQPVKRRVVSRAGSEIMDILIVPCTDICSGIKIMDSRFSIWIQHVVMAYQLLQELF